MKDLIRLLVVLAFMFVMAGCHGSGQGSHYNRDMACQEEMKALMSDQPGFEASPWCDSSFVSHLEAVR